MFLLDNVNEIPLSKRMGQREKVGSVGPWRWSFLFSRSDHRRRKSIADNGSEMTHRPIVSFFMNDVIQLLIFYVSKSNVTGQFRCQDCDERCRNGPQPVITRRPVSGRTNAIVGPATDPPFGWMAFGLHQLEEVSRDDIEAEAWSSGSPTPSLLLWLFVFIITNPWRGWIWF